MLTLSQLRKIDPELDLNDDELEALKSAFYEVAGLVYDVRHGKESGSKNPVRLFPLEADDDTLPLCQKKRKQE